MGIPIREPAASSTTPAGPVNVVLIRSNAPSTDVVTDVQLSREQIDRHLADPERVECPATANLGLPLCLVSPTYNQTLIPTRASNPLGQVIGNPENANAMASRLAIDVITGCAPGVVIGDAYAIRTDGMDFTAEQWNLLDNVICGQLLYPFTEGPGAVTDETWEEAKYQLDMRLEVGNVDEDEYVYPGDADNVE